MELKFITTAIKTVDQGIAFARKLMDKRYQSWIFRGQRCEKWTLKSGLERMLTESLLNHAADTEKMILEQFKRQGHQYINNPPALDDHLEWLALLQHHHGSTRLLDFTHSFHVAMFFALVDAFEGTQDSAIWCINTLKLTPESKYPFIATDSKILANFKIFLIDNYKQNLAKRHIKLESEHDILPLLCSGDHWIISKFVYYALENPTESVNTLISVYPFRLSERMSVQKSVFLFPVNVLEPFERNLISTYINTQDKPETYFAKIAKKKDIVKLLNFNKDTLRNEVAIIKVKLPKNIHYECWNDLEAMNITRASLFPGIDGFAASIKDKFSWDYRQMMR